MPTPFTNPAAGLDASQVPIEDVSISIAPAATATAPALPPRSHEAPVHLKPEYLDEPPPSYHYHHPSHQDGLPSSFQYMHSATEPVAPPLPPRHPAALAASNAASLGNARPAHISTMGPASTMRSSSPHNKTTPQYAFASTLTGDHATHALEKVKSAMRTANDTIGTVRKTTLAAADSAGNAIANRNAGNAERR
ncbi:MAG: hypothetical protein CYPHOPRED_005544 [Cyphobasidiales sp. Tagirdzhanova-0007]|nr:MAG: hypothetical protein CYPHOPRED_005544 [Cyphobasidiales sp. Tagirdzhanova-0007]